MRDLVGHSVGAYTILDLIDSGGVADVFRAKAVDGGTVVAVKVMKPEMLKTENLLDRFLREAQMMAALNHPHIIRVYDTGVYDQTPYIVMQLAEGGSLAQKDEKQPLSLKEISRVIAQTASALDYAHAHHTIHRDIKLENILLDSQGDVLLSDFGMAKPLVMPTEKEMLKTAKGTVLGTPYYISPEQGAGTAVDARSDVYSLGVLLFRLLTGTYPFRSPLPIAIITQHIREKPPLITSIKPELSPELAAVVDKALAKKPEDRYQSAGELARALQATLGEPLETFNTPKAVSVTTVPKKRRVPSRVLVLALIGIVIIWIAILFVVLLSNLPV